MTAIVISHRLAVVSCVMTILAFGAWGGILGPLLPAMALEFGLPIEVTGLLMTVAFTGSIVSVTLGGYLADHFGKKPLYLIALAGLCLAYLLFTIAPAFAVVALACLLGGALGGAVEGLTSAIIADLDPAHVDRNMNLLQAAFCAGALLSLLVTIWLRAAGSDWRSPYLVLAGVTAVAWGVGAFMRVPQPTARETPISFARARVVFSDRMVLLLAVGIALYVGSEMSLASWISPLLQRAFNYEESFSMFGAGLFWLTMGIGRVITGFACQRVSGQKVLQWLVLGGVASYILLLLPAGTWRLWAGVALAGFTFSGVWPLLVSLGSARHPAYSGTVVSMLVASGTVGALLFPSLTGFVIERAAPTWGILLMAVLFALLTGVVWHYGSRVTRARPTSCSPVETE